MDPRYSGQDILRCDLCATHVVQSHCELCQINVCKSCVGEHLSDSTKTHRVVPYAERFLTQKSPKCSNHSKNCELYCEPCEIPVCSKCISSGNHKGHHLSDINTEHIHQMFGSLSALSITTEVHRYTMETPESASCPPVKPLLDEPRLIITIDTGYKNLCSVTCLTDEEIWTCGDDKIMKLINLRGKLTKSIRTKSGNRPQDIAVTRNGYLVYTDHEKRTVNMMKNKQIQEMIKLQGWRSCNVCSTSSGDLLVTMIHEDNKQSKVVRFSGSKEKQTIQFDSEGKPLYSSGGLKYISENKNLDICVADNEGHAVVVVNHAGKLRFRYTGRFSTSEESFDPVGITTDSQSQILTADCVSHCIHIIKQDGQFLHYIYNCHLRYPYGLYVDTSDNLFVAEWSSGKVKKIKYILKTKNDDLEIHYNKLTTAVTKQGEDWHREINIIVNKRKSEIGEMKAKHMDALNKQEEKVTKITAGIKQSIIDLKNILDSNNISLASVYKSRNEEFRYLPPDHNVSLPSFFSHQINTEQLHQMFGFLSALSITTEERSYRMETPESVSCPPVKPLLDEPRLIITIDTGYKNLCSVTCLTDEEIWTCGDDKIMKLINLRGKLTKSIRTKSGNRPQDIAVTRNGYLVYTDHEKRTVNMMKNKQIQEMIKLQGWRSCNVCSTSSGDLLVTMIHEDNKQSKVVRFSGSKEKQTIQFDSEDKPLYSSGGLKYISENRNLDICVADDESHAVVVVNQAGKLRFRYTGRFSTSKDSFDPVGITTDSQSQILTADCVNHCIHIMNQDGQFLHYIYNCHLRYPYGLCVDASENLYVAEWNSGKVKKIKYM
ncbi:uncharacterized protein LOC134277628 [Saccostrea cucullata]|uniref:uncharacterized protein LOC134277628 n=1 Tax=Saccostrea cuccullata TaxID=36930 RepID=UPI002ED34E37